MHDRSVSVHPTQNFIPETWFEFNHFSDGRQILRNFYDSLERDRRQHHVTAASAVRPGQQNRRYLHGEGSRQRGLFYVRAVLCTSATKISENVTAFALMWFVSLQKSRITLRKYSTFSKTSGQSEPAERFCTSMTFLQQADKFQNVRPEGLKVRLVRTGTLSCSGAPYSERRHARHKCPQGSESRGLSLACLWLPSFIFCGSIIREWKCVTH